MTTIIQAALSAPPTCDAKLRSFDRAGTTGVPYCRVHIALKSLIDASGNRRWYCHAPGHRGLVVRAYGEWEEPEGSDPLTASKVLAEIARLG